MIVHRIIVRRCDGGVLVFGGDNNDAPDPWSPRIGDVVGRGLALVALDWGASSPSSTNPSSQADWPRASWSR